MLHNVKTLQGTVQQPEGVTTPFIHGGQCMGNQRPSMQPLEGCNLQYVLNAFHCMSVTAFTEQNVTASWPLQYNAREIKLSAISTKSKL